MDKYKFSQSQVNDFLIFACEDGELNVVKLVLTYPELTFHADIHVNSDEAIKLACQNGHLDIVKFLLTSSNLKEHSNINADNDAALILACQNLHFDVIEFLLTDGQVNKKINLRLEHSILNQTYEENIFESVKFIINDLKIVENRCIPSFNEKHPNKVINKLFRSRELAEHLSTSLNKKEDPPKNYVKKTKKV